MENSLLLWGFPFAKELSPLYEFAVLDPVSLECNAC